MQPGGTAEVHPVKRDAAAAFPRPAVTPALFEQQRVAVAERIEIVFHGDVNGTLDDADHLVGVEEAGRMEPSLPRGKTAGADKGDFLKHQVGFSLLFYCARRCERRRFSV